MPEVPFLKSAVVHAPDSGTLTLFLLNRSLDQDISVAVQASGFAGLTPGRATVLRHDDLEAVNTRDGEVVVPAAFIGVESDGDGLRLTLPPASWTVVQLAVA
jgi:alpha-N-arabinofuranosidase